MEGMTMIGIGSDGKNFHCYSTHGTDDSGGVLPGGEFVLGGYAAERLRELLAIPAPPPGLTAEQAEVARIEAELEQARTDGVITRWAYDTPGPNDAHSLKSSVHSYLIGLDNASTINRPYGETRLEAARAALARVRELRAEADAKKLPEPRSMSEGDVLAELKQRGWHCEGQGGRWCCNEHRVTGLHHHVPRADHEDEAALAVRALRRARSLDDVTA